MIKTKLTERKKKSILIGSLLAVVVLMGIAYAAFASNLTITGTGSVSSNWCIGFDSTRTSDYTPTAGISGGTVPTGSMSFSGDSCGSNYKTTASLNASFKQPGDKIEYTLTIGNKGTLPAAIESINVDNQSVTSDTTITKGNIKYIIEMPGSTSLAVNATTTMKVTAMFQNDTDVSSSGNEQQTISVSINAVQDDGNGGFTPQGDSYTGYIYTWGETYNGKYLAIDGSYTDTPEYADYIYTSIEELIKDTDYITQEDYSTLSARITKLGHNYYLKHRIVNDAIIESYVCFIYNNVEHCMKAGISESSASTKPVFDANTQIIRDYKTFNNLNDVTKPSSTNPGCNFDSWNSKCYGGGFYSVYTDSYGSVAVNGSSSEYCAFSNEGVLYCIQ